MAIMNKCEHGKYHGLCRICFPISTYSVKQLSDEEILKNWTWKYTSCHEDNLIAFARAIIKEITE